MGHFWSFLAWNQQGFTPAVLEVPVFWEGLVHDDSPSTGHRVHDLKSFTRVFEACLRVFFGEFCLLILRPTFVYFPDILVGGWTNPVWQFEATWIIRPKLKGVHMLKNIFEASPPSQKHPKRVNFFFFCLENNQPQGQGGLPYPDAQGSRCIDLHFPPELPKCWFSYTSTINGACGLGFLPGRRRYFHYTLTAEFLGNKSMKARPCHEQKDPLRSLTTSMKAKSWLFFIRILMMGFSEKKTPQIHPHFLGGKWLKWRFGGGRIPPQLGRECSFSLEKILR